MDQLPPRKYHPFLDMLLGEPTEYLNSRLDLCIPKVTAAEAYAIGVTVACREYVAPRETDPTLKRRLKRRARFEGPRQLNPEDEAPRGLAHPRPARERSVDSAAHATDVVGERPPDSPQMAVVPPGR